MSYELSFSPEFFLSEGEPYDRGPYSDAEKSRPTSVYMAIQNMDSEQWASLAREVFDTDPDYLTPEAVLERIEETNTCRNLSTPVEVYIDPDGYHSVHVY